jgi:hypothetical protein
MDEKTERTLKEMNEWQSEKIRLYRAFIASITAISNQYWDDDMIDAHAAMSDIKYFVEAVQKHI